MLLGKSSTNISEYTLTHLSSQNMVRFEWPKKSVCNGQFEHKGKKELFWTIKRKYCTIQPHTSMDLNYGAFCLTNNVSVHGFNSKYRPTKYLAKKCIFKSFLENLPHTNQNKPKASIEPKYGTFNLNNKVIVQGLVLYQVSWKVITRPCAAGAVVQTPLSMIHELSQWSFSSKQHISQNLSCIMCHMSHDMCHVSHVTCNTSGVTCQVSHVRCHMWPVPCHKAYNPLGWVGHRVAMSVCLYVPLKTSTSKSWKQKLVENPSIAFGQCNTTFLNVVLLL